MTKEELAKAIREDYERKGIWAIKTTTLTMKLDFEMLGIILEALEESKWIPVSKGNPIESDYYLATIKESSGEKVVRSVWYDGEWKLNSVVQNVIAWQPLPDYYREESDE